MEMNESEIVSSQSPIVESKPEEPIENTARPEEFMAIADLFNVQNPTSRSKQYLEQIWQWGKDHSPNQDKESVKFEIIRLKNRLGSPTLSEGTFSRIINYIKVYERHKKDELLLSEMQNA